MNRTLAVMLMEAAMQADERHSVVMIEAVSARRTAEMLNAAWSLGSPELRRYFANKDPGFADLWLEERP